MALHGGARLRRRVRRGSPRRICSCSRWKMSRWARLVGGAEEPQTVRRGMMKRPRYSRKRLNCGLPVASAIAQWKAKSWSTAFSPRSMAAWMAAKRSAIFLICAGEARSAASPAASTSTPVRSSMTLSTSRSGERLVEIDPERPAHVVGDESADALPGDHQPVGAQGGHRLPDDGAANAGGGDHFLLGRQARAGRQLAAGDVGGQPGDQLRGQPARGLERLQQSKIFWRTLVQRLDTGLSVRSSYDMMNSMQAAGDQCAAPR